MNCRISKTTAKQKKAIKEECRKEFLTLLDKYNYQALVQVMHILHFDFGFGQKRLEKFLKKLDEMQADQKERYDLDYDDTYWICEKQLRESSSIDIDALLKKE